jgi:hypothetical protein
LNITKTSQHHATLSAFHAFAVHDLYSLSIARTCTIARMSPFSGQCERLNRRLVNVKTKGLLLETSKFSLYFSGSFISVNPKLSWNCRSSRRRSRYLDAQSRLIIFNASKSIYND